MTPTQVPPYNDLLWPALRAVIELGGSASINELDATVIDTEEFSPEVQAVLHGDGPSTEIQYRLDRGGDFGDRRCGDGTEGEAGDGGRRFVASEAVEKNGEDGQRDADRRGVARIVVAADCQSEVIECGHRVAVFGLKSCQKLRQG
jgi:hypothetical protein